MHAADLFRVPAFALMGPTAFRFPTGPTVEILDSLPCRPCTKDGRGKCRLAVYQKCMWILPPNKSLKRLLSVDGAYRLCSGITVYEGDSYCFLGASAYNVFYGRTATLYEQICPA